LRRQLGELYFASSYADEAPRTDGTPSRAQIDRICRFVVDCGPGVRALAALNVDELAPVGGKWRNPAEANLILALIPLWRRVTARTPGLTGLRRESDEKQCRYAEWLAHILASVELPAPSTSRIVAVVKSQR
jgi:hypothetical protein